mmetsp:Transcript_2879/g.3929  ORF Transcript_2879/g.3929 Transcript_2879/m.3929 type:complete len:89 (-) Transcript_2879:321-587(-)
MTRDMWEVQFQDAKALIGRGRNGALHHQAPTMIFPLFCLFEIVPPKTSVHDVQAIARVTTNAKVISFVPTNLVLGLISLAVLDHKMIQ